jgi:hypothetical protein
MAICLWAAISAKSHPYRMSYLRAPKRKGFWAAQGHLPRVGGFQLLTSEARVTRSRDGIPLP